MKNKIVALLYQRAGTYVSGQEMSETLGISRTAVWKHIRVLQQEGYSIEAVHRKGYRLLRQQDALLPPEIHEHRMTKWLGKEIVFHNPFLNQFMGETTCGNTKPRSHCGG